MGSAIVVCRRCKTKMKLGDERWRGKAPYCRPCYRIASGLDPEPVVELDDEEDFSIDPDELEL